MKTDFKTELRKKLSHTYIECEKNSGEVYRLYFTHKQVDKIMEMIDKVGLEYLGNDYTSDPKYTAFGNNNLITPDL
jgi:hypothetical protein